MEARSCNHCCIGKAISIIHSQFVFVALVIQHAMRMRHIIICGLSASTIFFFHISSQTERFSKKNATEHKMCVLIFCTNFVLNISHSKKNSARYYYKFIINVRVSTFKVPESTEKYRKVPKSTEKYRKVPDILSDFNYIRLH
jgi:hypothetical protein